MSLYQTWNPMTGCDRVSSGCDGCYAVLQAANLKAQGHPEYQTDGPTGPGFGYAEHPGALDRPLSWLSEHYVFVNSRSDVFHEQATKAFVVSVFAVMATTRHTYIVLTKRPGKMRSWLNDTGFVDAVRDEAQQIIDGTHPHVTMPAHPEVRPFTWPLPNLRVGTSIEDQDHAFRLAQLTGTPAVSRVLEAEPLLGPLVLEPDLLAHLDQIVVGGEHGPNARRLEADWVRGLRDQAVGAGVAFLFKQWGTGVPGRTLDGREWVEWPQAPVPPA